MWPEVAIRQNNKYESHHRRSRRLHRKDQNKLRHENQRALLKEFPGFQRAAN
jgi:hypothetical protein